MDTEQMIRKRISHFGFVCWIAEWDISTSVSIKIFKDIEIKWNERERRTKNQYLHCDSYDDGGGVGGKIYAFWSMHGISKLIIKRNK